MTMRSLEVADQLRVGKIDVAVLHSATIKPRDEGDPGGGVPQDRLVVVVENHSVIGGLGEAVARTLLRNRVQPAAFQLAGLPDAFLDAGRCCLPCTIVTASARMRSERVKGCLKAA